MRSDKIELKSDLVNLFKDLEEAKRESKETENIVPISKPKIEQSDIKNLLSGLEEASKEARVVERKRKDYVETTPKEKPVKKEVVEQVEIDINSLENLMKDLSVAYETK